MSAIEQAIKEAVEKGGYSPAEFRERIYLHTRQRKFGFFRSTSASISQAEILLDSAFWNALGKARGLEEGKKTSEEYSKVPADIWIWHYRWHGFIDHLADGGEAGELLQ